MLNELKTIFEKVDSDILSEDVLKSLTSLIEGKISQKVEERSTLEVENALKLQLEKFEKASGVVIQRIDEDHLGKIRQVVEHLNKSHTDKLIQIKEGYEKIIKETAVSNRDSIVEGINDFIDMYIEQNLPREQIAEAARNQFAMKQIDEARRILGIDDKFIKNNVKEALVDGKRQVDKLIKENTDLKRHRIVEESNNILSKKVSNLPANVAKFVRSRLEGKSPEFIKENFQYVIDLYKRSQKQEKTAALINENKNLNVDRTRVADEILKEQKEIRTSNQSNPNNPMEDMYLDGLNFRK
jgi:hypothetical protein